MQIFEMMASIQMKSEYSDFAGKCLKIYSSNICQIVLASPSKWWKMKRPRLHFSSLWHCSAALHHDRLLLPTEGASQAVPAHRAHLLPLLPLLANLVEEVWQQEQLTISILFPSTSPLLLQKMVSLVYSGQCTTTRRSFPLILLWWGAWDIFGEMTESFIW